MLSALLLFSLGSTICGAASSMNMLIAGRGSSCVSLTILCTLNCQIGVQGLGAGAITSSMQIILSDLVTLRERGTFSGLVALYDFCLSILYPNVLT
jgi:MFS family permease